MDTILLIGADSSAVRALQGALQDAGYAVSTAPDGRGALEALSRARPRLIVLDLAVPAEDDPGGLSGRLVQEGGVPVVALGLRGTEGEAIAALEAGAADYLRRPYGPAEVVARVRAVLRRTGAAPARPHAA